jgi:hypothetical protein
MMTSDSSAFMASCQIRDAPRESGGPSEASTEERFPVIQGDVRKMASDLVVFKFSEGDQSDFILTGV